MASIDRYVTETAGIKARRSIFPMSRRVMTSYFHGYCQPIGVPVEVLPGDTFKARMAALIRMSTPVRPLMDNIRFELDCFFVPKRILWNKTKNFYGEAETFGIATPVDEPYMVLDESDNDPLAGRSDFTSNLKASETFASSFGLIYEDTSGDAHQVPINVLPVRAFMKCFNEFYRDQNYQNPYVWDMDETGLVDEFAYRGSSAISALSWLPKVNKDKDLFISILPWAQKGDPVTLPLGDSAPLKGDFLIQPGDPVREGELAAPLLVSDTKFINHYGGLIADDTADSGDLGVSISQLSGSLDIGKPLAYAGGLKVNKDNVTVDLSQAYAANINSLLYALAYQDFLTRAAHYGTKYKEYIYSMFGTTIADATEDIPEYLGRCKMNININQVLQTTSIDDGLGETGAYSVTGTSKDLFTQSFTEPGYLVFIGYCKHQRTYSSGIDKVFLKHELLDYYQPPFANIGDVPINSVEICVAGDNEALGFQEPWYDYHTLQDRVYGILNPLMPNSLANWTLAERFEETPVINDEFLQEDRTAFIDALVSGDNGPDYIMDFEFRFEVTRVMPLFSSNRLGVL